MSNVITAPITIIQNTIVAPVTLGIVGGGGGASTWDDLTGKPSTFPPEAHTHAASEVTGTALVTADATETPTASKLAKRDSSGKLFAKGLIMHNAGGLTTGIIPQESVAGEDVTLPGAGVDHFIALTLDPTGLTDLENNVTGELPPENLAGGATGKSVLAAATTATAWTALGGTGTAASPTFSTTTISGTGTQLVIKDADSSGSSMLGLIEFRDQTNTRQGYIYKEPGSGKLVFVNETSGASIGFGAGGGDRLTAYSDGGICTGNSAHSNPGANNLRVLGTISTANLAASGTLAVTGNGTMGNFKRGTGSPESVVTGNVGDLYTRTDGGAGTTLYVKESGTGNTGWVAK